MIRDNRKMAEYLPTPSEYSNDLSRLRYSRGTTFRPTLINKQVYPEQTGTQKGCNIF